MSDKAKAYIYGVGYFGLFWLVKDSALIEWLDSQGTIVWLIGIFAPLIPMLYWLRNEPTTSGKNLGALAVIGFIAGVLLGKKID
jgi:hypothetical protein